MLDIFSGLRLVIKHRPINIDNTIFRFHWFLTSTILVSFSLIITARQYVGQPIECHSTDKIPETLLNSYCWVQSTFTVPQACNQRVGIDIPYPCIDNSRGREIKMFAYYQWVGIVLFIQGLLFHLPYYLWKIWEAGLIRAITSGLRVTVLSEIERCKKKEIVIEYLHKHMGYHKSYALRYFICELFCLLNLLLQLWATDKFFDGQFVNYGLDVIRYSSSSGESRERQQHISNSNNHNSIGDNYNQHHDRVAESYSHNQLMAIANNITTIEPRVDPMTFIFPRITKCTYYDFGSSGDIQKHDAICLLPLNIVNEKIYIALWFWFLILALLTSMVIVFRFFILLSKGIRAKVLRSRCKLSMEGDVNIICKKGDIGDWFLFYMMANNLDPLIMREIVSEIAERLDEEIMSEKESEALASFSRIANCDNINSNLIERRVRSADIMTSGSTSDSMSTSTARYMKQPTTTAALGRKFRRRFNLRGFLKGGRLFSLDDSSAAPKTSQKGHMKRLNSLQGDRQHLFNGQLCLDLNDGSSTTYYRCRSKMKDSEHSTRQLENKQTDTDNRPLVKLMESSPIKETVDDTSSIRVDIDCVPLHRRDTSVSNNLTEIRQRNRSSERRGSDHLKQGQITPIETTLSRHLTLGTTNNGTLSPASPPARQPSNRSMTVVNMSS